MSIVESTISAINVLLIAVAVALFIPGFILFVECIVAVLPGRQAAQQSQAIQPRVNVLIPAHNEELGIGATIHALLPQLGHRDQVIVVADNCSDQTAQVAQAAGAVVVERYDAVRRGKGYALDFGVNFMRSAPPDVVIIVDADCLLEPGSIAALSRLSVASQKPVQGVYLIQAPKPLSPKNAVSTLAVTVKNWVRLVGLKKLGMPCLLTGTGMAIPWDIIKNAPLASGNLVEDMNLGLDLAIAGHSPTFCTDARIVSVLPQAEQAAKSQRTRWEHGHMQTIKTQVPRLLKAAIHQKRLDLFVLALDMFVPPLSLLVMVWFLAFIASIAGTGLGFSTLPLFILGITGAMITLSILAAWAKYCRQDLPAQMLLNIPLYVLWKIPLYLNFLLKPQQTWVRTERDVKPGFTHTKS